MFLLYILLGISILAPIYTYVLYPFVLRLFPKRDLKEDGDFNPTVSVLIVNEGCLSFNEKKENILSTAVGVNIIEIVEVNHKSEIGEALKKLVGEVTVITNTISVFEKDAIQFLLSSLSCRSVGLVCGMSRKNPDKYGNYQDGANWVYENKIKLLESNIGSLSGANAAIFAFRTCLLPRLISTGINLDFYIPTAISEQGFDVLFQPKAVAYEIDVQTNTSLFIKHVNDGLSARKSIMRFWRLLLPRNGSFVYYSHRVFKWFVPFNLLYILIVSCCFAVNSTFFLILFLLQLITYLYVLVFYSLFVRTSHKAKGIIGKLSEFACYFFTLNLAWFIGFLKLK